MSLKNLDRICLIVVLIVSAVCGYLAVNDVLIQKRQLRLENDLLDKGLKDLNLAEVNLQQLKEVLDNTRKALNELNERIPESARIGELLQQLTYLTKTREINLVSLNPLPTVKEKLYTKIPIRLLFNGSFINIYKLLYDLDNMNRVLVMQKMVINKPDLIQDLQVDLTGSVFER